MHLQFRFCPFFDLIVYYGLSLKKLFIFFVPLILVYMWLQLAKMQADYHRQSLKLLEQTLPSLTEEIGT